MRGSLGLPIAALQAGAERDQLMPDPGDGPTKPRGTFGTGGTGSLQHAVEFRLPAQLGQMSFGMVKLSPVHLLTPL